MPPARLGLVYDAFAAGTGPEDASQWNLSGVEFPHSRRHSGLTDTGGTGDRSDPAVAEGLGLHPCQQATLPLVEVRQNRLELGGQHNPLPIQTAHARPTNHPTRSHKLMICTLRTCPADHVRSGMTPIAAMVVPRNA